MYIFDSYALWRSLTIKQREEVKEQLRLDGEEGQVAWMEEELRAERLREKDWIGSRA